MEIVFSKTFLLVAFLVILEILSILSGTFECTTKSHTAEVEADSLRDLGKKYLPYDGKLAM